MEPALHGRASSWADGGLELLTDEGYLTESRPNHRAWIALSQGILPEARKALAEFGAMLDTWEQSRPTATARQALHILSQPGKILRVEERALAAVVARTSSQG